jgi:hypothetical protein
MNNSTWFLIGPLLLFGCPDVSKLLLLVCSPSCAHCLQEVEVTGSDEGAGNYSVIRWVN